jgi:hypothetical protein
MATTPNLEAEHWTAKQDQPEVTVNESLDVMDAAIGGTLTHNFASDADYGLIAAGSKPQEWQYSKITLTDTGANLTADRNVLVPPNEKSYTVQNDTAYNLTVKTSTGTGITVESGSVFRVRSDGTNVVSDDAVMFQGSEFRGYTETYIQVSATTAQVSLSCASANVFDVVVATANVSIVFTNVPSVGNKLFTSTVFVTQDGVGSRNLFVEGAIYASGKASTISQTGGAKDLWVFTTKDGGTTWYGMAAGTEFD